MTQMIMVVPDDKYIYMLLARLMRDCEYYFGFGCRAKKHLWAGDEVEQIKKMRELYASLKEKPVWLTLEDINNYERAFAKSGSRDGENMDVF